MPDAYTGMCKASFSVSTISCRPKKIPRGQIWLKGTDVFHGDNMRHIRRNISNFNGNSRDEMYRQTLQTRSDRLEMYIDIFYRISKYFSNLADK